MNTKAAPPLDLRALLEGRRVIVCCGSGGVGKTTVSAALALAAARRGRRALVCTIDPARRLANSLGLEALGNEPHEVDADTLAKAGITLPEGGSLSAMMLDIKSTFDHLVTRKAPDAATAERILSNHIYKQFSGQVAGSQEYMAMEKLYELQADPRYDLIVLDTPPTKHALDFLRAPERLSTFLEGRVLRWFLLPLRAGGKVTGLGARMAQKVLGWLDGIFGMTLLEELAEFFAAFETLWGGFKERAELVNALLRRHDIAAFLVVLAPTRETTDEALYFHDELLDNGLPMGGFVVNRVRPDYAAELGPGPLREALRGDAAALERAVAVAKAALTRAGAGAESTDAVAASIANLRRLQRLADSDRTVMRRVEELSAREGIALRRIPAFGDDVHDLGGLVRLDPHLLGPS
ncbi:MAG: ArsA family ATPase [Planctomycetota bacterium]|jgi:anion-transporting  ArsA/GET3 family ATPase